jgi:hypothetical protein
MGSKAYPRNFLKGGLPEKTVELGFVVMKKALGAVKTIENKPPARP